MELSTAWMEAITNTEHRKMVEAVLGGNFLEPILVKFDEHEPRLNQQQGRRNTDRISQEFKDAGFDCSFSLVEDFVIMQQLTIPVDNDDLALALSRAYAFPSYLDDVCSHSRTETLKVFADIGTGAASLGQPSSRYSDYINKTFNEIGRFCDPDFLGIYRSFFYESLVGVLMETGYTLSAADSMDTEYVRSRSGFCEWWFSALQFIHPCMDFLDNVPFWAAAMRPMAAFLNDINDALSFYKEALHGEDFATNSIYRKAVQFGVPYPDLYRATLDRGLRAQRRVLELANHDQKRYVENYIAGFCYWSLHAERYRWADLYSGISRLKLYREDITTPERMSI